MLTPARIAANLLEQNRRTVAELALARLELQLPENLDASQLHEDVWFGKVEAHIQTLAACLHFNSPLLCGDYVHWGSVTPDKNPPFPNEIETSFRVIEEIAQFEFPTEAAEIISRYVEASLASDPIAHPEASAESPLANLQLQYLSALLAMDRAAAVRLATDAIHSGVRVGEFYIDVLQPSQREIGRLWQMGKISVSQEHYCTAATQFVMSQLQPYFFRKEPSQKTLVAACVGDELHEVGLRIISDIIEMDGWNTVYLGANVPADSVAKTLVDREANVLAISTTMTRHLFALAELISVVRSTTDCQQMKIIVGGYPFNVDPFLWRRMGADDSATSASEAVRVANRCLTGQQQSVNLGPTAQLASSQPNQLSTGSGESQNELSRLNNELITAQRELNKATVELRHLYKLSKQKSKALEEGHRRKDEFLAMLAHELRGPLAPMNHALTILEMENVDATVIAEARGTIKRQIKQMARLVDDLLDASRVAHGKIELKMGRVNLSDVLERAIEIALPLIQENSHNFTLGNTQPSIVLEGDDIRLTQVFANLLSNAAKYTKEGGNIGLSYKIDGDQAAIEIRDNGIGIDSDVLPHIFETFTQDQRGRMYSQGGLGIGLSLVKQLVDLHRGTVVAESDGAGKGCTFTVRLPALETFAPEDSKDDERQGELEATVSRRVLIVDDSAGIAKITARLFQMLGHESVTALDGKSAIQQFQQTNPEIVVLDLILPDMSGLEVARKIRSLDQNDRTLIVAQTGLGDQNNRKHAQAAGIDEYLVKPVDIAELKKLVIHAKLPEVS